MEIPAAAIARPVPGLSAAIQAHTRTADFQVRAMPSLPTSRRIRVAATGSAAADTPPRIMEAERVPVTVTPGAAGIPVEDTPANIITSSLPKNSFRLSQVNLGR